MLRLNKEHETYNIPSPSVCQSYFKRHPFLWPLNIFPPCMLFYLFMFYSFFVFHPIWKQLIVPNIKWRHTLQMPEIGRQYAFYHWSITLYTGLSLVICITGRHFLLGTISCFSYLYFCLDAVEARSLSLNTQYIGN